MKIVVVGLIVLLAIVHHDSWWWDAKEPLVFGFMPIGLAWHAFISLAAGCVGALAVKFCWPHHLDEESESSETSSVAGEGGAE